MIKILDCDGPRCAVSVDTLEHFLEGLDVFERRRSFDQDLDRRLAWRNEKRAVFTQTLDPDSEALRAGGGWQYMVSIEIPSVAKKLDEMINRVFGDLLEGTPLELRSLEHINHTHIVSDVEFTPGGKGVPPRFYVTGAKIAFALMGQKFADADDARYKATDDFSLYVGESIHGRYTATKLDADMGRATMRNGPWPDAAKLEGTYAERVCQEICRAAVEIGEEHNDKPGWAALLREFYLKADRWPDLRGDRFCLDGFKSQVRLKDIRRHGDDYLSAPLLREVL